MPAVQRISHPWTKGRADAEGSSHAVGSILFARAVLAGLI